MRWLDGIQESMDMSLSELTCQNSPYKKRQQISSVDEDVEKREPLCPVGGNISW